MSIINFDRTKKKKVQIKNVRIENEEERNVYIYTHRIHNLISIQCQKWPFFNNVIISFFKRDTEAR